MILGYPMKVLIAGTIGGAVSMVLGDGRWWEKILRCFVGATSAVVGHHVFAKILVGLLDIPFDPPNLPTVDEMEPIAAFTIGLIGMVACQAAINAATAVRDRADDFVEAKLHTEDKDN